MDGLWKVYMIQQCLPRIPLNSLIIFPEISYITPSRLHASSRFFQIFLFLLKSQICFLLYRYINVKYSEQLYIYIFFFSNQSYVNKNHHILILFGKTTIYESFSLSLSLCFRELLPWHFQSKIRSTIKFHYDHGCVLFSR